MILWSCVIEFNTYSVTGSSVLMDVMSSATLNGLMSEINTFILLPLGNRLCQTKSMWRWISDAGFPVFGLSWSRFWNVSMAARIEPGETVMSSSEICFGFISVLIIVNKSMKKTCCYQSTEEFLLIALSICIHAAVPVDPPSHQTSRPINILVLQWP